MVIPTNQGCVGIILLSFVSFSAYGAIAVMCSSSIPSCHSSSSAPQCPDILAESYETESNLCFFGHHHWLVAEHAHVGP